MIELTHANDFNELKTGEVNFFVLFSASWCAPCKVVSKILNDLDDITAYKMEVDWDENKHIPSELGFRSVPFLAKFSDGVLVKSLSGNQSKETIDKFIRGDNE